MSDVTLQVAAVQTKADFKAFVDLPYHLYDRQRYPQWVPPLKLATIEALDARKNPFYHTATRECFLAWRGTRVVGRIAAIENRAANTFHGDRVGYWGFFECADDVEAARGLLDAAGAWLAARGLTEMVGPMNPSTNYECGLLVGGFENRPTFMTPWNPPYYDTLLAAAEHERAKDLLGLWFPVDDPSWRIPEFVDKLASRAIEKSRVAFRPLEPRRFVSELKLCWDIYNSAWEANWGFVPMPFEEFKHMAKDMRFLIRREFSYLATVDGVPAAFMIALPDYNVPLYDNPSGGTIGGILRMLWYKGRARRARVMALGVRPEYRTRSLLAVLMRQIAQVGIDVRGEGAEASWLLEDNTLIVQPLLAMGTRERMRWRIYRRAL